MHLTVYTRSQLTRLLLIRQTDELLKSPGRQEKTKKMKTSTLTVSYDHSGCVASILALNPRYK
jgi:hypothetical protein